METALVRALSTGTIFTEKERERETAGDEKETCECGRRTNSGDETRKAVQRENERH